MHIRGVIKKFSSPILTKTYFIALQNSKFQVLVLYKISYRPI